MAELQTAAAGKVRQEIAKLPDGAHHFEDQLDDGTPLSVTLTVNGEQMRIDFAGTGAAMEGNLNAPRAVVHAAVIYVLRSLVAEPIPLNGGCLEPVEILIPERSLLDPPPGAAVVGGNVETSQRIVDVLLGAIGRVAASQGTMNNVAFGDEHFGYYETIGGRGFKAPRVFTARRIRLRRVSRRRAGLRRTGRASRSVRVLLFHPCEAEPCFVPTFPARRRAVRRVRFPGAA